MSCDIFMEVSDQHVLDGINVYGNKRFSQILQASFNAKDTDAGPEIQRFYIGEVLTIMEAATSAYVSDYAWKSMMKGETEVFVTSDGNIKYEKSV